MKLGSRQTILCATGFATAWLLGVAPLTGQTEPDQKPLMVEDVFENVQVLKAIPVTEFMATIGFFSASLGFNCTNCHTAKYADDMPTKQTARRMIQMVDTSDRRCSTPTSPRTVAVWEAPTRPRIPKRPSGVAVPYLPPMGRPLSVLQSGRRDSCADLSGSDRVQCSTRQDHPTVPMDLRRPDDLD